MACLGLAAVYWYLNFLLLLSPQIAMNGFSEVLNWILCSYKENFSMLSRKDDKSSAVIIANPRSADFEVCVCIT